MSSVSPSTKHAERRAPMDRRRRSTPMFSRFTLTGGRRAGDRRSGATSNAYVDRYPMLVAGALIAIAVLCALDAVFTLQHLQKGGGEANPIMDALLGVVSPRTFLIVKCAVTNLGLLVLCLHANFRFVKPVIALLLVAYSALLAYHIWLAKMVA